MHILLKDDFDLYKIMNSGQCFRAVYMGDSLFRFITGRHVLYIRHLEGIHYEVSCSRYVWNHVWKPYFDLSVNYRDLRKAIDTGNSFLRKAAGYSQDIRILRQDPWEMLITFIISQRKSIPAIRSSVEKLCLACGKEIRTLRETLYTFPTPAELCRLSMDDLNHCSLGYRSPYIYETAHSIKKEPSLFKDMALLNDDTLVDFLMHFPGVGLKVANCTALFGFHRTSLAPVDVWINRVIQEYYHGLNPFAGFGESAGIMQQYFFYYAQSTKMKDREN